MRCVPAIASCSSPTSTPEAAGKSRRTPMTTPRYAYAVHVLREDDTPVRQLPVEVDWEPAREALRLQALRDGRGVEAAFTLDCQIEPEWHPERGSPYLAGFRVRAGSGSGSLQFGLAYFRELSRSVTKRLVADGALQQGDVVRCLPVAFPLAEPEQREAPKLGRQAPPRLALGQAALADFFADTGTITEPLPVLIPERVLDEAKALTLGVTGRETGGILIGRLHRDTASGGLFAEVTAQIPARHTEADAVKLSFTPATWTEVQAALDLRTQGESMLGWWHSHPVREWCKNCPEDQRRQCTLARGFFSEDDRLLHRTVFPRAYSIALLVNDVEWDGPTFSLFGWDGGLVEARGFHRLTEARDALVR